MLEVVADQAGEMNLRAGADPDAGSRSPESLENLLGWKAVLEKAVAERRLRADADQDVDPRSPQSGNFLHIYM